MLSALASIAAATLQPAATPPVAPADSSAAATKADPVVCRRESSEVGTHMRPKPVCMKKSEWDFADKRTQDELKRFRDRGAFDPGRAEGH